MGCEAKRVHDVEASSRASTSVRQPHHESAGAAAGNLAMQALLRGRIARPKLEVGAVDDPEEREADETADRVMRSADGSCCAACTGGNCNDDTAQRKPDGAANSSARALAPAAEAQIRGLSGSGEQFSPQLRAFFEPRLNRDLSDVRVHRDAAAAESARSIGARAYTLGSDIAFASGQWQPETESGRRLIAHELAHVAQQGSRKLPVVAAPFTVWRQATGQQTTDADDKQLAEQFENELAINEENADQEDDLMLRAYASRVVLLLTIPPHKALRTQDDLDAVILEAYDTAEGEIETMAALGGLAEFGVALRPFGFPLTWAARITDTLSLGIDSVAVLRAFIEATTDFVAKALPLSDTILVDGLPVPLREIDRLTRFHLRLEDAKLEHGGPVSDFARATIRYMQLRYLVTFALTWESGVKRLADDVRDGKLEVNWFEWKLFVDNKQQILKELPNRTMVALATSEDAAHQIETDTIGVTNAAVGLGLSSALIGLLSGILGGWQLGAQLFDGQITIADGKVASAGDGERLVMALRWAYANGYFGAAAMGFVDGLIANGPKILATMAGIVIAQFIPGVDILLDVYLYFTVGRDVIRLIGQLGSALSDAMNANSVVTLQQASASLARVLTEGGMQILMVLGAAGIGRAVSKLRGRAAQLRDAEPGLSESEAERRAMKDLSEEDRAPLERAQEIEGSGWKKSLSKEDQDFLNRPENAATKKMWEEMNPTVREILTRCGSSCIPHNATAAQTAEIEALVDRLGVKGDLIDALKEYFHTRRDILQAAIDDVATLRTVEELESVAYRSPIVPPGATADMATRIGNLTAKFALSPAEQAILREYLQLRTADLDAALARIEGISNKSQLTKVLRQAAEERTPAAPGTPAVPKGSSQYAHAIQEHSAGLSSDHMRSRALTKPKAGTTVIGVPQGQWYNDSLIVESDQRFAIEDLTNPAASGFAENFGRLVRDVDFGRPAGRVFLPDGLVVSDVTWIRIIRTRDGTFFDAFPITPPGVEY